MKASRAHDPRLDAIEHGTQEALDRQRLQDRLRTLGTENTSLRRQLNDAEDLRSSVFKLAAMQFKPPRWALARRATKGGPGIPMLLFSDSQWGEVIRANELGGINEFNLTVARRRYETLIQKTCELAKFHMVKPNYPGIVYMRGGDMISGDIHQELRETNEVQSIPQVRDLVDAEIGGIELLRSVFGRVWVISVAGNHGRTTMKPTSKRAIETNYDTLSAWMLEMHFKAKGLDDVTFYTPPNPDALFSVYGYQFLLTHGDRIGSRGGQGFIGCAATVARGMKKLTEYYAGLGRSIDTIFIGHFHEYMELPWGFVNGSLPGFSEYARDGRFTPRAPSQLLTFVHPNHGITARWPILLEEQPRLGAARGMVAVG